jgi:hypothetical protein
MRLSGDRPANVERERGPLSPSVMMDEIFLVITQFSDVDATHFFLFLSVGLMIDKATQTQKKIPLIPF